MTADSLSLKEVTTTTKNEAGSEAGDYAIGESTLHEAALQRHLKPRQVQFFAIGGSIGTALFITIGYGLLHGGAGSLLIAFILQSIILSLVNNALAEMTIFMPVSAAFIQHADVWVDKAWAFMIGWNFFLFEAILVPFEITALDLILTYWRDDIPSAAVISACIFTYGFARFQPQCSPASRDLDVDSTLVSPISLQWGILARPSSGSPLGSCVSSSLCTPSLLSPCAVEIRKAMRMGSRIGQNQYYSTVTMHTVG